MKNSHTYSFFSKILLDWDRNENFRELPWKQEKDPYKIWLSEIMLQQTRVEQGSAYYHNFISSFPTVEDLAGADENLIYKKWEGLGYYSRCRNLIHTARYVARELRGIFPDSYTGLLHLKGVGPYTAAAIASFAYNECRAVVDGNVIRVLSRVFGIDTPWDTPEGKKRFEIMASQLIDPHSPGTYNQAIMDFGATLCKPRKPDCHRCPFQKKCKANLMQLVDVLPIKSKKIKIRDRWFHYLICHYQNGIYIQKREQKDIWHGLHEFILIETENNVMPEALMSSAIKKIKLPKAYKLEKVSSLRVQKLTHQTIHARFYHLQLKMPFKEKAVEWIDNKTLRQYAFPRLMTQYLEEL